jgi:hypothetical protein
MLTATARAPEFLRAQPIPSPAIGPELVNPYVDLWVEQCEMEMARKRESGGTTSSKGGFDRAGRMMNVRRELVKKYSFAIPTEEAIRTICSHGPLIEIGAGTGYWAWCVRQLGGDILVYDIHPPQREACPSGNRFHGNEGCWTHVEQGTETMLGMHPDRTLLLGWPPFQEPLALQALQLYRGEYFLYIGSLPLANGWKGPMASDAFLEELGRDWWLTQSIQLPNWDLCWDALHVFKRRRLQHA